jgi:hypothetical protein
MLPLGLASVALLSGCGATSALYRGTIIAADDHGHSFDVSENHGQNAAIQGAEVRLAATDPERTCEEIWLSDHPPGYGDHRPVATTDFAGHYQVYTVYSGMVGATSAARVVCVRHPDFEPYRYMAIDGQSKDPRNGEKFLNIRLKPRKHSTHAGASAKTAVPVAPTKLLPPP